MAGNGGFTIGTTIGGTVSDPTGLSFQSHLVWAVNDAAWWLFNVGSSSTTTVASYRNANADGSAGWTTKTASGALVATNSPTLLSGRDLGGAYKNISSNDVVHFSVGANNAGNTLGCAQHARASISGGTVTWSAWAQAVSGFGSTSTEVPSGPGAILDSNNRPFDFNPLCQGATGSGDADAAKGTNTDAGTSWTAGMATGVLIESVTNAVNAGCLFDVGSGNLIALYENASSTEPSSMTNVRRAFWNGTNWTSIALADVFTAFTAEDPNNFGAVAKSTSDIHVVAKTGSNTYVHKRINASGTISAGDTITNQASVAGAGIFLATDGTFVWMFVIDSAAGNAVRYSKWTSGSGWGAWTAFEDSSQTRKFLSGYPNAAGDASKTIGVIWTQTNGANFDVVFEGLATAAVASTQLTFQPSQRVDPLQDSNDTWYRTVTRQQPSTVLLLPPVMAQDSQRIDPSADFNLYQQYAPKSTPPTFLPLPPIMAQDSQRIDPLPNLNQEYAVYTRQQPVPVTALSMPPTMAQDNQRIDPPPNLNPEWQVYARTQPVPITFLALPPAYPARSQITYTLPNLNQEWEVYARTQPLPVTYLPLPPTLHAPSQRLESLPDLTVAPQYYPKVQPQNAVINTPATYQASQRVDPLPDFGQYVQYQTHIPLPTFLPMPPALRAPSQRIDPLPNYDQYVQQESKQPIIQPITFLSNQPSQRLYSLPDWQQEWQVYARIQPQPITFLPPMFGQHSQRFDTLPDLSWVYQNLPKTLIATPAPVQLLRMLDQRVDPLPESSGMYQYPIKTLIASPVSVQLLRMLDQRLYVLPPLDAEWQSYTRRQPVPIVRLLPTQQPGQRIDPLPDLWAEYTAYSRSWPVPVQYIPTPPPTRQPSQQRSYELPEYTWSWYEQFRLQPIVIVIPPVSIGIVWTGITNTGLTWMGTTSTDLTWMGTTNTDLTWTGVTQ